MFIFNILKSENLKEIDDQEADRTGAEVYCRCERKDRGRWWESRGDLT